MIRTPRRVQRGVPLAGALVEFLLQKTGDYGGVFGTHCIREALRCMREEQFLHRPWIRKIGAVV